MKPVHTIIRFQGGNIAVCTGNEQIPELQVSLLDLFGRFAEEKGYSIAGATLLGWTYAESVAVHTDTGWVAVPKEGGPPGLITTYHDPPRKSSLPPGDTSPGR